MAEQTTTGQAASDPNAPAGINFKGVLQEMIRRNGSDLHLKVGRPPTIRVDGELTPLDQPPLRPDDLKSLAEQLMTPRQVQQFADDKECDFAIGVPGSADSVTVDSTFGMVASARSLGLPQAASPARRQVAAAVMRCMSEEG